MSTGKRTKFYGTAFSIVTAWGTPGAITGISNAAEAVVTQVAHGMVTGDVVQIAGAVGMEEVNDQAVYAVELVTVDTYKLSGVDSTNWGIWTSGGTGAKATFSSSCEISSFTGDSGTTSETTSETNCGIAVDFGAPDPGSVQVGFNNAETDFQSALEPARKAVSTIAVKRALPKRTGVIIDIGTITQVADSGSAGGLWTGSFTMRRITDRVDLVVA